jgi:hypothetical protein
VFFIFRELFNRDVLAFIGSVIFTLLPNKLEMYHTPVYATDGISIELYLLCLLSFLYFLRVNKRLYLFISAFFYFCGVFSYEVGYFMPVALLSLLFIYRKKAKLKTILPFIGISSLYAIYRLTHVFGTVAVKEMNRQISLSAVPLNFIELLHHYVGRYLVRSVLYGFYKYFSIEHPWLLFLTFVNLALIGTTFFLFKKCSKFKIDGRIYLFGLFIFGLFLVPNLLDRGIGIAGRHLVLPSVGFTIVLVYFLEKTRSYGRYIWIFLVAVLLIVCEGNAWCQVVACRINNAVYEYVKENKQQIIESGSIIIDTKSFADNIPFTLLKRNSNVLNTYYGAQAFEDRFFTSTIYLFTGKNESTVYVAKTGPVLKENGRLEFSTGKYDGYRKESRELKSLPMKGCVIIDYKKVYGNAFNNGLKEK